MAGDVYIERIREPLVNGIFYPDEKELLKKTVTDFLDREEKYTDSSFAVISPHACYDYAGDIMAAAYKSASKRKISTVVILAPLHRENRDEIILPESCFFKTPLGLVRINDEITDELLSCSNLVIKNDIPHLEEHCIEIQLPFIQVLFPEADIVPVLMSKSKPRNIKLLSNALQLVLSNKYDDILFAVSANIASCTEGRNKANDEAGLLISLMLEGNWQGIQESLKERKISTCGADCISALLNFNGMKYRISLLKQNDSERKNPESKKIVH